MNAKGEWREAWKENVFRYVLKMTQKTCSFIVKQFPKLSFHKVQHFFFSSLPPEMRKDEDFLVQLNLSVDPYRRVEEKRKAVTAGKGRARLRVQALQPLLDCIRIPPPFHYLDVGCSEGILTEAIADAIGAGET